MRMTYGLSFCAAAANNFSGRTISVVRCEDQRQRRWCRDDLFIETNKKILCEREVSNHNSVRVIARPEVKEPEVPSGVFAYFCHC